LDTKKAIYIIRHGETEYNKKGIIQGSGIDSDLNATGILQSQLFYRAYHHINFNKIYTSKLKRTIQSVSPFREKGIPVESLDELNEINWGIFEGKAPTPDAQKAYNRIISEWQQGLLDRQIEGGESPKEINKRQKAGLLKIMSNAEEETILIAMHGRALKCFLCLLTGTPLEEMENFKHNNLCLYHLEYTKEKGFEIIVENSLDHLLI
jgi:phosphoserine phosphatase